MTKPLRNWLVVPFTALLVLALDQWSKQWVLDNLSLYETRIPVPALGEFLAFTRVNNTGVAFGMFQGSGIVSIAVALAVVAGILVYARHLHMSSIWMRLSLGLLLGGAVGNNLLDRLRHGHVTDFIDVGIGQYRFYIFNVADSAIVVGTVLLVLLMLLERESPASPAAEPKQPRQTGDVTGH